MEETTNVGGAFNMVLKMAAREMAGDAALTGEQMFSLLGQAQTALHVFVEQMTPGRPEAARLFHRMLMEAATAVVDDEADFRAKVQEGGGNE